jgi:hypothetical protein
MASILKVNTIQDATNSNTAISVDSSGRVTLPQRIAFMGKKTDTATVSASSSANVTFNNTKLAHASWDQTTFTAPIAGIYRIFINGHKQSLDANPLELAIYKNGAKFETAYSLARSDVRTRNSVDALMDLAVNDAITFRVLQGDTYGGDATGTGSSLMCSGYLIG